MNVDTISFILLRIMPVIYIFCFTIYLINAFRYRDRYSLDKDWISYGYKAGICLVEIISLMCVDLLEIKNLTILTVILVITVILLVWTIFTNIFHKQEEKNRLYRELIYIWNQEDLTDFQKHMSREEQIGFLKSIKKTIHLKGKEEEIYYEAPLIVDDEQLKLFEPILKKEKIK